jgi:hypothetical protein
MRLAFAYLLGISSESAKASASSRIRGHHSSMSASTDISAFHLGGDGRKTDVANGSEDRIKQILCSSQVLSHLERCPDPGAPPKLEDSPFNERLYPMNDAYREAVDRGYACPLPGPFMHVSPSTRRCCIASQDPNVWPNFCENIESLGNPLGHEPVKWEVGSDMAIHISDNHHVTRLIPKGVYRIGVPDVPETYAKRSTSVYLLATYFVMSAACFGLLIVVFNQIAEEDSIMKGKQREEIFARSHRSFVDDDDDDEDNASQKELSSPSSRASSLSPARDRIARNDDTDTGNPSNLMGQVSLSFGLLPPLPRGRSTNPSSLNSPRLTARGQA